MLGGPRVPHRFLREEENASAQPEFPFGCGVPLKLLWRVLGCMTPHSQGETKTIAKQTNFPPVHNNDLRIR